MAGPTDRARLKAAWHAEPVSVAGSCSLYRLRPRGEDEASAATCRLAWSSVRLGPIRPSGSVFALGGEIGTALGVGLGLRTGILGVTLSLHGDVARYEQRSGATGSAGWLRLALARPLTSHLDLRLVGEGGRGADFEHDVRGLVTLSHHFRGVRP